MDRRRRRGATPVGPPPSPSGRQPRGRRPPRSLDAPPLPLPDCATVKQGMRHHCLLAPLPLHRPHSRRQGGSSPSSLSTSSSAGAGEGRIPAAGRLLSLYLELGRCRGGPDPAPARADPATAASLRHGGAGPVAGRRGGRWTRALRGSRPVGRRRRLRLCEADCAWEGGDGCRAARGRRKFGPGRIDGKLARIRIHFSVSGPFNLGYADTPWIRIRAVSVSDTYPTRDTRVPWRIRVSEELEAM